MVTASIQQSPNPRMTESLAQSVLVLEQYQQFMDKLRTHTKFQEIRKDQVPQRLLIN